MKYVITLFVLIFSLGAFSVSATQLIETKPVLTLDGAKFIAKHAANKARSEKWNVIIAIVDTHGYLVYLERMDGVQLASLDVAIGKARTSVLYKRPTKLFEDRLKAGDAPATLLPNLTAFAGGVPIVVDGHVIGSIGISGVRSGQDDEIAKAGVDAFLLQLNK